MAAGHVYRFAGVEFDTAQNCLRRDGREQYLRAKSFQVLLYLVENRDRLVPKEEIIAHVWKESSATDDVLFHSIKEIRTVLGDSRENARFIRTYAGAGYRFVAPIAAPVVAPVVTPVEGPLADAVAALSVSPSVTPRRWVWGAGLAVVALAGVWAAFGRHWPKATAPEAEIAWWRFDEASGIGVVDSAGGGHRAELAGNPVRIDGVMGRALQFEGVTSYVVGRAGVASFPLAGAPRTASAWIRTSSTNGDHTAIFYYGGPYATGFALSMLDNGRLGGAIFADPVRGATRVDDGAWHMAAVTYDGPPGNMARLYVDGRQDAARQIGAPLGTEAGTSWRIGRAIAGGTPFRGAIDDVRLYGRALSAQQMAALYGCSSHQADVSVAGRGALYEFPIFPGGAVESDGLHNLRHLGTALGGVQFARSDGACSLDSLRGADLGEDLSLSVDLLVPAVPDGGLLTAGPYLRSRAAAPGDGIIGGRSAGYWVQLYSDGVVKVRCLNPHQIVAFTAPSREFDARRFHHLQVRASAGNLEVTMDGRALAFDQGGKMVETVAIPAAWDGPPRVGSDRGTAGIAFSAEPLGAGGGQQARNLQVAIRP